MDKFNKTVYTLGLQRNYASYVNSLHTSKLHHKKNEYCKIISFFEGSGKEIWGFGLQWLLFHCRTDDNELVDYFTNYQR